MDAHEQIAILNDLQRMAALRAERDAALARAAAAEARVAALTAENAKLRAVADAAQEYVTAKNTPRFARSNGEQVISNIGPAREREEAAWLALNAALDKAKSGAD